MLTLAIGDLYIPERSVDLPKKFRKLLSPNPDQIPSNNKISHVICLGNIVNSIDTLTFLHNLSPSFHLVSGESDDVQILSQQLQTISKTDRIIPLYNVITHDNLKIGFTNGFQIVPKNDPLGLSALARELDVDILIWGGTHKVEAYTLDGKFFINPGSATGAFNFDWPDNDEDGEEEENMKAEAGAVAEEEEEAEAEKEEEEEEEEEKLSAEAGVEEGEANIVAEAEGVNDDIEAKENFQETEERQQNDDDQHTESTTVSNSHKEQKITDSRENLKNDSEKPKPLTINDINRTKETISNDSQVDQELLNEFTELNANIPSFCLLDIQGSTCTLYIYTYIDNEVKVDKVTYSKE